MGAASSHGASIYDFVISYKDADTVAGPSSAVLTLHKDGSRPDWNGEGLAYQSDLPSIATASGPGTVMPMISYSKAATGGMRMSSDSQITVNGASSTAGRYYPLETDSIGLGFVNVPWENTHNVAKMVAASTTTSTSNASSGNPHLNIVDGGTVQSSCQLIGMGGTSVTADSNGNITISSPEPSDSTESTSSTGTSYYKVMINFTLDEGNDTSAKASIGGFDTSGAEGDNPYGYFDESYANYVHCNFQLTFNIPEDVLRTLVFQEDDDADPNTLVLGFLVTTLYTKQYASPEDFTEMKELFDSYHLNEDTSSDKWSINFQILDARGSICIPYMGGDETFYNGNGAHIEEHSITNALLINYFDYGYLALIAYINYRGSLVSAFQILLPIADIRSGQITDSNGVLWNVSTAVEKSFDYFGESDE
jgi:hypothetical protein